MMVPKIYGTTTLNEKGQAVIPADARHAMNLEGGTKLLVMGAMGGKALMLVTTEQAEKMMEHMMNVGEAIRDAKDDAAA